jgi:hypothetical protein
MVGRPALSPNPSSESNVNDNNDNNAFLDIGSICFVIILGFYSTRRCKAQGAAHKNFGFGF